MREAGGLADLSKRSGSHDSTPYRNLGRTLQRCFEGDFHSSLSQGCLVISLMSY